MVSTIYRGHLDVSDGGEEAVLVGRREGFDLLRTDTGTWGAGRAGCAAVCDESKSDPQVTARSPVCTSKSYPRDGGRIISAH